MLKAKKFRRRHQLRSSATDDGGSADTNDVTNISLVDEDGKVVAGPAHVLLVANAIRFSDTIS